MSEVTLVHRRRAVAKHRPPLSTPRLSPVEAVVVIGAEEKEAESKQKCEIDDGELTINALFAERTGSKVLRRGRRGVSNVDVLESLL